MNPEPLPEIPFYDGMYKYIHPSEGLIFSVVAGSFVVVFAYNEMGYLLMLMGISYGVYGFISSRRLL